MEPDRARHLEVTTVEPLRSLPRVGTLGHERRERAYLARPRLRPARCFAVVQATVAGCGAAWPGWEAGRRHLPLTVPPGHALGFISGGDDIAYGLHPDGSPWEFVYIEWQGDGAFAAVAELVARHGHVWPLAGSGFLDGIRSMLTRPGRVQVVWDAAESARCASALLAAALPPLVDGGLVQRAAQWMLNNLHRQVEVAELAAALRVSREHLTRCFRNAIGEAPAGWMRRHRLEHAERLLCSPGASVAAVARQVGFRSVSHFIKAYRERFQRTPGKGRATRQGPYEPMKSDETPAAGDTHT